MSPLGAATTLFAVAVLMVVLALGVPDELQTKVAVFMFEPRFSIMGVAGIVYAVHAWRDRRERRRRAQSKVADERDRTTEE